MCKKKTDWAAVAAKQNEINALKTQLAQKDVIINQKNTSIAKLKRCTVVGGQNVIVNANGQVVSNNGVVCNNNSQDYRRGLQDGAMMYQQAMQQGFQYGQQAAGPGFCHPCHRGMGYPAQFNQFNNFGQFNQFGYGAPFAPSMGYQMPYAMPSLAPAPQAFAFAGAYAATPALPAAPQVGAYAMAGVRPAIPVMAFV